jgi:hypothetical protein
MSSDFYSGVRAQLDDWQGSHHILKDKETCRDWCEFEYSGQIFISHRSVDAGWCRKHIVQPIELKFGRQHYFFLSAASDPNAKHLHNALVEHAFRFCKTIVIVISQHYLSSDWTNCEAAWAVEQQHPIIVCLKDSTEPAASVHLPIEIIDFRHDPASSENKLLELLGTPVYKPGIAPLYQPSIWGPGLEAFRIWRERKKNR